MSYNIHPIFVHFPIALLVIYSAIRILPLAKWFPAVAWKDIERALLVFGTLGAFAALSTGELAEELVRPNHQLVEAHSTFATAATWMYVSLLLGELSAYISAKQAAMVRLASVAPLISFFKRYFSEGLLPKIIALVALVTLSIAGLLGGAIVYGTTADPLAGIVLKMLGISL